MACLFLTNTFLYYCKDDALQHVIQREGVGVYTCILQRKPLRAGAALQIIIAAALENPSTNEQRLSSFSEIMYTSHLPCTYLTQYYVGTNTRTV